MKSGLQALIFTRLSRQVNPRGGKISPRHTLVGIVIAVVALLVLPTGTATAASPPISGAHILAHFDLSLFQLPENITLEPNGTADLTFNGAGQIVQETLDGHLHLLATMPVPANGGTSTPILGSPFLAGIVRTHDGTLYFNYSTGTTDLTGIWRLRPGSAPMRIAALTVNSLANGLALDEQTGMLYIADSALGTIWRVSIHGGTPTAWASAPELARTGFLGVNGIKVHNDAVWATNTDAGTLQRFAKRLTPGQNLGTAVLCILSQVKTSANRCIAYSNW